MRYLATCAAVALVGIGMTGAFVPDTAEAQRRIQRDGWVTACSRYGNGCVSGPTRPARIDREVRMPGGTWIPCKLDCRETLREETVDFFDTLRERAPGGEFR